jgi:hypothetical protein
MQHHTELVVQMRSGTVHIGGKRCISSNFRI